MDIKFFVDKILKLQRFTFHALLTCFGDNQKIYNTFQKTAFYQNMFEMLQVMPTQTIKRK